MNNYFEVKAKYTKIDEATGKEKKVTEAYLVDALSVTEAEARTVKKLEQIISGEFTVKSANESNIMEVFSNDSGGKYHKCKVSFIDLDAISGKKKKTSQYILVEATNVKEAFEGAGLAMVNMLCPFEIPSVSESNIMDVFNYFDPSEIQDHEVAAHEQNEHLEQ